MARPRSRRPDAETFEEWEVNPSAGDPHRDKPVWSPETGDAIMRETLAIMDRRNAIGVTSGALVERYEKEGPARHARGLADDRRPPGADVAAPAEFHRYLRRIVESGLGNRVMVGSDQMVWPEALDAAIQAIEIARHHGKERRTAQASQFEGERLMPDAVAIVAGATGLVGQALVRQLAADATWRQVRALVRHTLPPELAGPTVVPVRVDYAGLDPPPPWSAADHVFCALGTTMRRAGSAGAFRQVDFDYPVALARAARAGGARHFLLVSALGAAPGSRVFYNRVKGEVEAAIAALGFRSVTIARPSLLLGRRREPRLTEQLGKVVGILAPPRWRPVPAASVARALVEAAKRDQSGVRILENRELRAAG